MSARARQHRKVRLAVALALAVVLLIAGAGTAAAHPLGNFTVNHYAGVTVAPDGVAIDYVVDMAEIPTFQEDAAHGTAQQTERYAASRCRAYATGLTVHNGGASLPLEVLAAGASFPPGQGGLPTTRVECALRTVSSAGIAGGAFRLEDTNGTDRIGWREITVVGLGVEVRSDAPEHSISDRLTAYPEGSLDDVPRRQTLDAELRVVDPSQRLAGQDGAAGFGERAAGPRASDPLSALVGRAEDGAWAMVLAVGVAMGLGALHGLAPGHGKTVVAAYLVGTRGSRRQAAGLAAVVALSHTSGVFLLGGLTLVASAAFPLERVYAWLQLGSAAIVVGLGVWLTRELLRNRRRPSSTGSAVAPAATPGQNVLAQVRHGAPAALVSVGAHHRSLDMAGAVALADATPTDARHLPHRHHDHDHGHGHGHGHGHAPHGHDHAHVASRLHRHGLLPHRHRVAWDQLDVTQPLRWKVLIPLGLSGGVLPSASAVIVLLGAVQIGRIGFGAALIVAFGMGMALALVGVGLGVVALSRRATRRADAHRWGAQLRRWTAPAAAATLLIVGVWLSVRALTVL